MKNKTSTKANLLYNMTYQVVALITPLLTAPYVSRVLGANGVGAYSYYHSIAIYFVYFAMLGLLNYGNRTIAKVRDDKKHLNQTFSEIYTLQLITSLVVLFVYILFSFFIVKENKLIAIILIIHVISAVFDVSWLFFGLEEFKITSTMQMIIKVATFILIFLAVKNNTDLWKYAVIMSMGYLISALSLWGLVWKRVSLVRINLHDLFKHLKPCLILFIPIIATSIYRQMDKIMVGSFSGMLQVGYYENAEKMISISLGVISAFSAVFMPKISNLLSNGQRKEADYIFDMSMEFAMCLGIAIAFGLASIAKEFVPFYFGTEFVASIYLLILLSASVPFVAWACIVRTLFLIPGEKDKIYVQSVILGACLNAVINLMLIPRMQAVGAVVGTLVAESSVAIYQTVKAGNEIRTYVYVKQATLFCFFGIIMTCFVRGAASLVHWGVLGIMLEIAIGALVYSVLSIIYLYKSKNKIALDILQKMKLV